MIISGQAFTNKSAILSNRERGAIKKWYSALPGP